MKERQRHHDDDRQIDAANGAGPSADLRQQAERLLAAGSDIIDRALSGDSEAFLDGNRQEGGQ